MVPSIEMREVASSAEVIAIRAVCDGCDPARPCDEHARSAWLWTVTAGAFEFRDASGRRVLDPTRAMIMPAGHTFVIRHPAGADVCVSYRGPIVERLAERGARLVTIDPRWSAATARILADGDDGLALAEQLAVLESDTRAHSASRAEPLAPVANGSRAGAASRGEPRAAAALASPARVGGSRGAPLASRVHGASRAERELVAAIEHVLRLDLGRATSLEELAARAGYSLFHACRVFRAVTGHTIHAVRRELRLRHALVRIVDGDEPLAEISDACGFASQSHLTNLFRARFGITPATARKRRAVPG